MAEQGLCSVAECPLGMLEALGVSYGTDKRKEVRKERRGEGKERRGEGWLQAETLDGTLWFPHTRCAHAAPAVCRTLVYTPVSLK